MGTALANQVAIVTGASSGIGAGIARQLAADGAKTIVHFLSDAGQADEVAAAITQAGGQAVTAKADISDPAQITALFEAAEKAFGTVTLLVNNAGARGDNKSATEVTPQSYEKIFGSNVRGPVLCMVELARRIGPGGGKIVNITSGQARTPMPHSSLYAGTKGAMESLTRAFAADLGPQNITVNAVAPGATGTEVFKSEVPAAVQEQTIKNTALGRLGTPEDIAAAVSFLLSDDARWITGQIIDVNGGLRR